MARKSFKQANVQFLSLKFDGGLNYSQAPANIKDNELTRAINIIYNSQTGTPETRPGTSCCMAAKCDGDNPILKGYYYEKSASEKWHVAACNGNLYYRSGTLLDAWTKIGALNDNTTVPSFLTYNSKLLIADGGTNIKRWDGTTYDSLSDGLSATALATIKGRVVANSSTSADLVTLSGEYDETHWNTATEGAVALRAGYGDNMSVNCFAVFGDDLIISKRGDSEKRLYRLNVADATTTNWYVENLSDNNCAQNAHCMVSAFNNVYFVDTNGFKSIKGVTEYGDLQIDLIGSRVNTLFGSSTCDEIVYLPLYTAIWYLILDRVFCYHHIADVDSENKPFIHHAFTDLIFNCGRIRSVYQAGDYVYLCGNDGYLYKMDDYLATDATSPSASSAYSSVIKTKQFPFFGQGILRKTQIYLSPIKAGAATLELITPENESIALGSFILYDEGTEIYDMTGEINDLTQEIYSLGTGPSFETSFNRARGSSFQWKFTTTSGRVGLEKMNAEIALVEGV